MSTAKTAITIDTSGIRIRKRDVHGSLQTALDDVRDNIRLGLVGVSADATHIGTLEEVLLAGDGISLSTQNGGGNETRTINVSFDGIDLTATAGESISIRDMVYLNEADGKWYQQDNNATGSVAMGRIRGCAMEAISMDATGLVRIEGVVSGFTALTAGLTVYASTTAGGYTQTKPLASSAGTQIIVSEMGYATSTTSIYIEPKQISYRKRGVLANGGTLSLEHHVDNTTYERDIAIVMEVESATLSSLVSYDSGNQDSDVPLRDQTPSGSYGSDECSGGTASASTDTDGAASDAFDNNNATYWGSAGGSSGWLEYDFGTTKTIEQYTVRARSSSASQSPMDWTFEYYNGSSWTVVDTVTGETGWGASEQRVFPVGTANTAQRWRINVTDNDGGGRVSIAEMEMMEATPPVDGDDKLAQSFEVAGSQIVKSVDLWLKKVGSPAGTLTLRIETDNSGEPSGTLADANLTTTVAESSLSSSYGAIAFTFTTSASISGSTPYWLVLSTDRSASETDYVAWGADGSAPSYADGEMMSELSSSWSAESADAIFEVFEAVRFDASALIDDWGSALATFLVRLDDGAGSNDTTQTTIKNNTGSEATIELAVTFNGGES